MGISDRLVWSVLLALAGCSGSKTDAIDREIRTAEADAAAEDTEEPRREATGEEDEDAGEVVELDTGAESDGAEGEAGAATEVDAARDAGPQPGASTPKNYLRPEDSPFAGVDFAYFYLEDFEDHMLNTPGLRSVAMPGSATANGRLSSTFGASVIDSVDGDDGMPNDNRCAKADGGVCDAWWGSGTLTFSFDAALLGSLPTHVGGVWTDGLGVVSFEVFGANGASIYKVGPLSEPGFPDNTTSSSTAEDRFFGAYDPRGISAFTISNTQGGVEMDHVQYGRARDQ